MQFDDLLKQVVDNSGLKPVGRKPDRRNKWQRCQDAARNVVAPLTFKEAIAAIMSGRKINWSNPRDEDEARRLLEVMLMEAAYNR